MRAGLLRKAAAAVVFAYETVIIALELAGRRSDRFPTVSRLCGRHRWLRPVVVGALVVHLYPQRRTQ